MKTNRLEGGTTYLVSRSHYLMKKITLIGVLLLIFLQCANQPVIVKKEPDQQEINDYHAYMRKPALTVHLSDQDMLVDHTVDIGMDSIIVLQVHWPEKDSTMLNDSGWIACHDLPTMSCRGEFRFFRNDTTGRFQYPEYLCIEYQYKNTETFDTVYLDSIAHFCMNTKLSRNYENGKFENIFSWRSETIENADMKIKYMTIAVDNGLYGAEYYNSFPNDGPYKDGEPDGFEGYRNWYSSFSPYDNRFNFKTEQSLMPFFRTNICVKSYPEYDIRIWVTRGFD
jgi:hypothetical protein